MTYYVKSNYLHYDDWFDDNIDPCELEYEKEKNFSDSVHEKFYKLSKYNLIIGGSESVADLNKSKRCSGGFCPLKDEELKQL
tara:strand:+ start:252 stop:497 length:246 start_codon:yes stop_codon:yes gene_type:complete